MTDREAGHLFNIIIGTTIITRFSEFYADRIIWQNDVPEGEAGEQFKMKIPSLVSFYHQVSQGDQEKRPVVSICMHCKDVRDTVGKWRSLETSLSALDRNSMFSHSICGKCHEKYHVHSPSKA